MVVGLSGGIASGKTAATDYLKSLGVPIIDADEISRELLKGSLLNKPNRALLKVKEHFGIHIFDENGYLMREKLREIIFHNSQQKSTLEAIIHPLVYLQIRTQVEQISYPYVIVSIPLLAESAQLDFFDRIIIIDVTEEIQLKRCRQRDNSPLATIKKIIATQASRQERLKIADDVIDNSGDLNLLHQYLNQLHQQYLSMQAL